MELGHNRAYSWVRSWFSDPELWRDSTREELIGQLRMALHLRRAALAAAFGAGFAVGFLAGFLMACL